MTYFNNQYAPLTVALPARINYIQLYQKNSTFAAIAFILECCNKLEVRPSTFAYAASIFHRVIKNLSKPDYDKFTVATGSIYLASKTNEDPVRLKDVINVSQVTLDREGTLSELGNEAWILSIRDTIVQCELFIMRVLHFDPSIKLPHPYLLSYLNTIENWLDDATVCQTPIAKCSISLLQDFYSNSNIVSYEPQHVAVACLVLTFQIYGLKIPAMQDDADTWYKAFCPKMTIEHVWEIIDQILRVYEFDVELN